MNYFRRLTVDAMSMMNRRWFQIITVNFSLSLNCMRIELAQVNRHKNLCGGIQFACTFLMKWSWFGFSRNRKITFFPLSRFLNFHSLNYKWTNEQMSGQQIIKSIKLNAQSRERKGQKKESSDKSKLRTQNQKKKSWEAASEKEANFSHAKRFDFVCRFVVSFHFQRTEVKFIAWNCILPAVLRGQTQRNERRRKKKLLQFKRRDETQNSWHFL